jgi:hypothetical protein
MPKMIKKAQQMRTMFPIGFRDVMRVSTTSFRPGALLITLTEREGQKGLLINLVIIYDSAVMCNSV